MIAKITHCDIFKYYFISYIYSISCCLAQKKSLIFINWNVMTAG